MRQHILLLATCALIACGSDASTNVDAASAPMAGTYVLKSMNGTTLPYTFASGPYTYTVTADALTLTETGSWTENGNYTVAQNGGAAQASTLAANGTYVRTGASVTFKTTTEPSWYVGTFTGSSFTLTDGLRTHVFVKQ
jgi:hypothetical protein